MIKTGVLVLLLDRHHSGTADSALAKQTLDFERTHIVLRIDLFHSGDQIQYPFVLMLIIYMKKFLHFDRLRAVQFFSKKS